MNKEYENIIDNLYEQSILNFDSKDTFRHNIHVSDIVEDCARKPWYRLHGYKPEPRDFAKTIPLVHGTMLHECTDLGGKEHEVKMATFIKNGRSAIYTNTLRRKEDKYKVVQGSMDDLVEIDGDLIICDKKTTKSMPREISERYKKQLNIYKLLYYINHGVDVKYGAIIYIDKPSGWSKHKTIIVELLDVGDIRELVLDRLSILGKSVKPKRVESYFCNWCPHLKECNPPNVFHR